MYFFSMQYLFLAKASMHHCCNFVKSSCHVQCILLGFILWVIMFLKVFWRFHNFACSIKRCYACVSGGKNGEKSEVHNNITDNQLFFLFRCSSCWSRKAFYPEVTTMLCTFWLCFWSTKWPKVEGSKTSSFKWNGRIYHTQSQCDYRTYLPWSSTYGKWFNKGNYFEFF